MCKQNKISQYVYDFGVSLLPPEGETITLEEFEKKFLYELGRAEAIADTADPAVLHSSLNHLDIHSPEFAAGYRDYATAWLVINRQAVMS